MLDYLIYAGCLSLFAYEKLKLLDLFLHLLERLFLYCHRFPPYSISITMNITLCYLLPKSAAHLRCPEFQPDRSQNKVCVRPHL